MIPLFSAAAAAKTGTLPGRMSRSFGLALTLSLAPVEVALARRTSERRVRVRVDS